MKAFSEFFDSHLTALGIKSGDHLLMYSNISSFGILNKKVLEIIINNTIKRIGKSGTLLMPAYTFQVNKNYLFNVKILNKNFSTSSLARAFFKLKGIKRSNRPIHSHIGVGAKAYILNNMSNPFQSFEKNTDFDLMQKNNFKCIFLGCSPAEGGTYFLYLEHRANVKHRRKIIIKKKILKNKRKIEVSINYSDRPNMKFEDYDLNSAFEKIRKKLLSLRTHKLKFGISYAFKLKEFDKIVKKKLKSNQIFLLSK